MTDQEINEAVARKLGWVKTYGPVGIEVPGIERTMATYFIRPTNTGKGIGQEIIVDLPDYCHSIAAAFEILGNQHFMLRHDNKKWRCWLNHKKNDIAEDTAPMAICLAFLKLDK